MNTTGEPEQSYDGSHEVKWGKLDNTAHLFPVIAGEGHEQRIPCEHYAEGRD